MRESELQRRMQIAASGLGARLHRNNVCLARTLDGRRTMRCGLAVGSSDLIGWDSQGRFVSVEVKVQGGRVTQEQKAWIAAVRASGGLAGVARSVEDVEKILAGEILD